MNDWGFPSGTLGVDNLERLAWALGSAGVR